MGTGVTRVIVGCPVKNREWILPRWKDHVVASFEHAGLTPEFAFVVGTSRDNTGTLVPSYIRDYTGTFVTIDDPEVPVHRDWSEKRYEHMAELRNLLLTLVREQQPDYFLSVDSDILLHPLAVHNLLQSISEDHLNRRTGTVEHWDAVGGKTYLNPRNRIPTYAFLRPRIGLHRPDSDGVFPVEVIMAIKLMSPTAYNVQYEFSHHGEDIGWSLACNRAGLKLGWDGRVTSKHVMHPDHIDTIDARLGW